MSWKRSLRWVVVALVVSLPGVATRAQIAKSEAVFVGTEVRSTLASKPLPNFPLRYRGAGRFLHTEIPSFQLVANYTLDMGAGVNREMATFIDHEVEIFNVYDMDPSDGVDPDRE